jgi:energy-coupling factor transporter ATP-binding protein EcfA2
VSQSIFSAKKKGGRPVDFYQIRERIVGTYDDSGEKRRRLQTLEIYPDFRPGNSKDLMVRGRSFYAIWNEEKQLWSTDESDVQILVDRELRAYKEKRQATWNGEIKVRLMESYSSNSWRQYKSFIKDMFDTYKDIDNNLTFANTVVKKTDYVSKRLPYPLEPGPIDSYEKLMSTLYDPEERAKLEWAVGAIVAGDAKHIQKFVVLYGEAGSGKSTFLNIVQKLFAGYYTSFEAKALTSSSNAFATEVFKTNPLVAIQHDGDLSRIEDNTKLNSIISHEEMTMNEKYKASYTARSNAFLFMGTNKPVKITDAKSGIIRRLIDVRPSGRKVSPKEYHVLMNQIDFELGGIASHCLEIYRSMGKNYYSSYRPIEMMYQTDVFFNFMEDNYFFFKEQNGVSLTQAYDMYKVYCEEALVEFKLPKYKFREELKAYFREFNERARLNDGKQVRNYYSIFLIEKFENIESIKEDAKPYSLVLDEEESLIDEMLASCPAQYANEQDKPYSKWDKVTTTLSELDTHKTHYVKVPENHIVIDFDLKDAAGKKSVEKNLEAASKWPPTYAEYSKGGAGIHLHYIYDGDPSRLSRIYSEGIEIKVFVGGASLRRRLSKCNNLLVAIINSGLPLKEKKVINGDVVKSEKGLRDLIARNLRKEIHPGTKPSTDFIYKILEDAYSSGMKYDVTDLRPKILTFANNSTNQADYCLKLVNKMHFASEETSKSPEAYQSDELIFFDVEVFPNLFIVVWKKAGKQPVKMINPKPSVIEELMHHKLVGFNCRRYDNHILYAWYIGYDNLQLYELSQKIVNDSKNCMFGEAYNISYTDVYDFASADNKMSLKKWEIQLGIHHKELGLPWDQPVPEELWETVADYCCNDVIATEAVFNHLAGDWTARQILAELSGLTVNDTTNQHTIKIVFGNDRKPQVHFNKPDLSELFPGYKYEAGKSTYRGYLVGEGGRVYAQPGIHIYTAVLDIASQHPSSIEAMNLFGKYTKNYSDLKKARIAIKHKDFETLRTLLDGKLIPFLDDALGKNYKFTLKDLSNGLKTALNSAYGLTWARFENPFRDPRNIDNVVAKRGALFMVDLQYEVEARGFTVAHIKTDSIKIPNATPEIIDFVMKFGEKYGYTFEHEATYEKMCLVNDAVFISKYASKDKCMELYGYIPEKNEKEAGCWTATGAQFAHPYVFKTLFSHEPLEFKDYCETKSVYSALYLDMNEGTEEEHNYRFIGKVGSFCPVIPGSGGGVLYREMDGKYYAATGTTGYRWLESEMVKELGLEQNIDIRYHNTLVDKAIENISKYGDFEWLISDEEPSTKMDNPPWNMPCGKFDCAECSCLKESKLIGDKLICSAGYECQPF